MRDFFGVIGDMEYQRTNHSHCSCSHPASVIFCMAIQSQYGRSIPDSTGMVEDCGDSKKASMKLVYLITVLVSVTLMSLGCENRNASRRSEMQNLIEEIPSEERAPVQEDFLAEKLSLTAEQREQVGQISRKYAREVDSILLSDDWRSKKARRFKSAMKNKDRELKTVFSKEQYKMYGQIREELRQKLRGKR